MFLATAWFLIAAAILMQISSFLSFRIVEVSNLTRNLWEIMLALATNLSAAVVPQEWFLWKCCFHPLSCTCIIARCPCISLSLSLCGLRIVKTGKHHLELPNMETQVQETKAKDSAEVPCANSGHTVTAQVLVLFARRFQNAISSYITFKRSSSSPPLFPLP